MHLHKNNDSSIRSRHALLRALLGASLLASLSVSSAQAVSVSILQPSPTERTLAPGRDFLVLGELSDRKATPYNVRIDLLDSHGVIVRHVESHVHSAGATPADSINTQQVHSALWNEWNSAQPGFLSLRSYNSASEAWTALLADPPPDLVGASSATLDDPTNKAVVNAKGQFAALVMGGITAHLPAGDAGSDLTEGSYTLRVSAVTLNGNQDATAEIPLTFKGSNMVFARFSPCASDGVAHKENVTDFARQHDLKIMYDYFPGYWARGKLFYEYAPRWRPNDLTEYLHAPVSKGVIYNISSSCATQNVEIGGMMARRFFQDGAPGHKVFLYHYDYGDPWVRYRLQNGELRQLTGSLVPFDKHGDGKSYSSGYDQLIFTRAERRDAVPHQSVQSAQSEQTSVENTVDLTDKAVLSQGIDLTVSEGVRIKPGQTLSLYGVVAPLKTDKVILNADGTYSVNDRFAYIAYSIRRPDGSTFSTSRDVTLTRQFLPGWKAPSIYEFRNEFGTELFTQSGDYQFAVQGFSLSGQSVADTSQNFTVTVSDLGIELPKSTVLTRRQEQTAQKIYDCELDAQLSPQSWRSYAALSGTPSLVSALDSFSTQNTDDFSPTAPFNGTFPAERKNSWWGNYVYGHTRFTDDSDKSYTVNAQGFSLGYQRQLSDTSDGSIAVSYARPTISVGSAETDGKDYYVALSTRKRFGNGFSGSLSFGAGRQDYSAGETLAADLKGNPDGTAQNVALEFDRSFQFGDDMLLRPAFGFSYAHFSRNGLSIADTSASGFPSEQGDDWKNEQSYNGTTMRLGFYLNRYSRSSRWYAQAFYNRRLGGDSLPFSGASFASRFYANTGSLSALMDGNSVSVGLGFELRLCPDASNSCFLSYEGEFSHQVDSHTMRAGYKMLF